MSNGRILFCFTCNKCHCLHFDVKTAILMLSPCNEELRVLSGWLEHQNHVSNVSDYHSYDSNSTCFRYSPEDTYSQPANPQTRYKRASRMEGHCLCGAISVKVKDSNLFSGQRRGHFCHCRNCRRVAGGVFGANLAIEAEKVEIRGGDNLVRFMDKDTTSGTPMARCFCKHCGT